MVLFVENRKDETIMRKQYLEAGKIVGTHGLAGELRVQPWCDSSAILCKLKKVYLGEGVDCRKVLAARVHKNVALMKLEGVNTVSEADTLREKVIYLDRNDLKLEKGSYFLQDMMGLEVIDADNGTVYGTLTDIFPTGANDVYEVTDANKKTYLMPAIREVILSVDIDGGRMTVRPIPGIFDGQEENGDAD